MRALIVDDDFYSRSFLEYILHPYARCDVAVNGEDAIMLCARSGNGNALTGCQGSVQQSRYALRRSPLLA